MAKIRRASISGIMFLAMSVLFLAALWAVSYLIGRYELSLTWVVLPGLFAMYFVSGRVYELLSPAGKAELILPSILYALFVVCFSFVFWMLLGDAVRKREKLPKP